MSNEFFNLIALIVLVFDCVLLVGFLDEMESINREIRNYSNNLLEEEDDDDEKA